MKSLKLLKTLLLSLPLFLLAGNAWAVTEFHVSVKTSGGDYTSIALAESAFDVNLNDDNGKVLSHGGITGTVADGASVTGQTSGATGTVAHATDTQILIYAITGTFQNSEQIYETEDTNYVTSSSAPDNEQLIITVYNDQTSFTLDGGEFQSNYDGYIDPYIIRGDTSSWDGKPSGAVTITAGGAYTINIRDRGVALKNFYITGSHQKTVGLSTEANNEALLCDGCGFGAAYNPGAPGSLRCINSVSIDSPATGFSDYASTSADYTLYCFNCVAISAGTYGFAPEFNGSVYAYNSASFGATTADFSISGDYNACSDTSCNGFTNYVSELTMADELVDGANGDVHIKAGSNLIDAGNDYSATTGIDYDIDNVTRSGTWDIGADEYVAAASARRFFLIQ